MSFTQTAYEFSALLRAAGVTPRQYGTLEGTATVYQCLASSSWRKTLRAMRAGQCQTAEEYRQMAKAAGVTVGRLGRSIEDMRRMDAVQVSPAWRKQLRAKRAH